MRYSLEPNYRKYVEGQCFMSFAKNIGNRYGKSLINSKNAKILLDGATSVSKDFAKTAGKKVFHKSAEATGDLICNKIAGKISYKPRNKTQKEKENLMEKTQEPLIPPEKRKQIIIDLKLF